MRGALALGLLALTLLGWTGWWVVCNVYEFAPRLPTLPLVLAWLLGWAVGWRVVRDRPRGAAWHWVACSLAVANTLWVAMAHQAMSSAATPLMLGVSMLAVGWAVARDRATVTAPGDTRH